MHLNFKVQLKHIALHQLRIIQTYFIMGSYFLVIIILKSNQICDKTQMKLFMQFNESIIYQIYSKTCVRARSK